MLSGISGKKFQVFFYLQYALKNTKTGKFLTGNFSDLRKPFHSVCYACAAARRARLGFTDSTRLCVLKLQFNQNIQPTLVAQLVERETSNQKMEGSIPASAVEILSKK